MRKALALLVAAVALAGCGTNISAEDKATADSFMDGKSQFEKDALCEELSTAEGRLQAKQDVENEIGGLSNADIAAANGPAGPEQDAAIDRMARSLGNSRETAERAESIVSYIKGNRC